MSWQRNSPRRSKSCLPDLVPSDESPRHERLRIARDLHDTFAQTLAGLGYSLDSVIADESLSARSKRELRSIRLDLSKLLQELRDEILALRHQEGASQPRSEIEDWLRERLSVKISWIHGDFNFERIPSQRDFDYLLLELLHNAIKHQGVTEVEIADSRDAFEVSFRDRDSSIIHDLASVSEPHLPKLGRVGVLERAAKINIDLEEREDGFTLRWQM